MYGALHHGTNHHNPSKILTLPYVDAPLSIKSASYACIDVIWECEATQVATMARGSLGPFAFFFIIIF